MTACQDCTHEDCKSLDRIINILNVYNLWLNNNTEKDKESIIDFVESSIESFSNKQIINNYNHIKHKNYHLSSSKCTKLSSSSSECVARRRHKRDNSQNFELKYSTTDIQQILFQRMLDQIHIFIYHPFTNRNKDNINRSNRFCSKVDRTYRTQRKREFAFSTNPRRNKILIQPCTVDNCQAEHFDSIPKQALLLQMFTKEDKAHIQNCHPSC